jgi:16S rRNA (cytosine967-C5)-methyltransferase
MAAVSPKRIPSERISPERVSPARKAAYQILLAVERGKSHSDDLLRGKQVSALSAADRNLATALVLGVLRWQIRLDEQIRSLLKKPGARIDAEVSTALRMGAFQLFFLDRVPARAAIDESVELAKQAGHRFASGMVNAVLRKLSVAPHADQETTSAAELAVAKAHPLWMVGRWVATYGIEEACAICAHGQEQPELTVRMTTPEVEAELAEAGILLKPAALLTAARTVVKGDVTATAAFREGRVRIQDEGSQLVAETAAFAGAECQRPENILDACAAPGGKTLILLERNPQAHVVACEASEQRLTQLTKRLAVFGDRVECRLADARSLGESASFDLALADVPCSGTGTLGRNPEIRHRLSAEDLPRHAERQRAILTATLAAVRPRGRIVYSTCSLEGEENDQVVAAVLKKNPRTRQLSLVQSLERMAHAGALTGEGKERLIECVTDEGALVLLPGIFGTDGFFIALLEAGDEGASVA